MLALFCVCTAHHAERRAPSPATTYTPLGVAFVLPSG